MMYGIKLTNASGLPKGPWLLFSSEQVAVEDWLLADENKNNQRRLEKHTLDEFWNTRVDGHRYDVGSDDEEDRIVDLPADEFWKWFFETQKHNCRNIDQMLSADYVYTIHNDWMPVEFCFDSASINWHEVLGKIDGDYYIESFTDDEIANLNIDPECIFED